MDEKKELRIVYRRGTEDFAEDLCALIDGRCGAEAAVWTENEYLDSKRTMTGGEYVVFLGEGLALDREGVTIPPRFEQFGMRWGLAGRRALISATERPLDSKKKIRAFLEHVRAQYPEVPEAELEEAAEENMIAWHESIKATLNPFAMVLDSMFKKPVSSAGTVTAVGRLQYRTAVAEFVKNGLEEFLA